MTTDLYGKILRFLIAGSISTAFLFSGLLLLHEWLGLWYLSSSAIALFLTIILSFVMQKFWAFKNTSLHDINRQFYIFLLLAAVNFFANLALMYVFVEYLHLWYFWAQVITVGFIATWDFILYYFVIFPHRPNASGGQANSPEVSTDRKHI